MRDAFFFLSFLIEGRGEEDRTGGILPLFLPFSLFFFVVIRFFALLF